MAHFNKGRKAQVFLKGKQGEAVSTILKHILQKIALNRYLGGGGLLTITVGGTRIWGKKIDRPLDTDGGE